MPSSDAGQVNAAVIQLIQTILRDASSSEELAATAEETSSQAMQAQDTMTLFNLSDNPEVPISDFNAHQHATQTEQLAACR